MKLLLQDDKYVDRRFINFVIKQMQLFLIEHINDEQLYIFNKLFLESEISQEILAYPLNNFDIRNFIYIALNNLIYRKIKGNYIIEINPNKYINNLNVAYICKLLNYGNNEIRGYPIFTNCFEYILRNINSFYNIYLRDTIVLW